MESVGCDYNMRCKGKVFLDSSKSYHESYKLKIADVFLKAYILRENNCHKITYMDT
jgi:hypothetical protein